MVKAGAAYRAKLHQYQANSKGFKTQLRILIGISDSSIYNESNYTEDVGIFEVDLCVFNGVSGI